MYTTILALHSWIRWIAPRCRHRRDVTAMRGGSGPSGDRQLDRWGLALVTALDIQLLLGLVMYLAASPIMMRSARISVGR